MILTVTMNPSIDMSYPVAHLKIDDVNRVTEVSKTAGGKGLNVSRVLHLLKQDVIATGIVGGHFGAFIEEQLGDTGIAYDFSKTAGESRNSIAILHDFGNQTEILEPGPTITNEEEQAFLAKFTKLLQKSTSLTISGSLAKGLSKNLYTTLVQMARKQNVAVLLDTSGDSLKNSLMAEVKPTLIKPNETEIGDLLGVEVDVSKVAELKQHLKNPLFSGVEWIVVSMGAQGAIAKHDDIFYQVKIPKIEVVNPVGSGDSTLAGLASAIDQKASDEIVLKTAMTTGMLNTMESKTGWINPDNFDHYYDQVKVTII